MQLIYLQNRFFTFFGRRTKRQRSASDAIEARGEDVEKGIDSNGTTEPGQRVKAFVSQALPDMFSVSKLRTSKGRVSSGLPRTRLERPSRVLIPASSLSESSADEDVLFVADGETGGARINSRHEPRDSSTEPNNNDKRPENAGADQEASISEPADGK